MRACTATSLLLAAAFAATALAQEPQVAAEAFAADDACAAQDGEDCELSLRQLRAAAGQKEELAPAQKTTVPAQKTAAIAKHEQAKAEAAPAARPVAAVQANATAGGCTAEDQAQMAKLGGGNLDGSFPKISSECGHKAYSWFSFHPSSMASCLESRASISSTCAACFVKAGQYGVDHCKLQCLFGSWCSRSCLGCSSAGSEEAKTCAGVPVPEVAYC